MVTELPSTVQVNPLTDPGPGVIAFTGSDGGGSGGGDGGCDDTSFPRHLSLRPLPPDTPSSVASTTSLSTPSPTCCSVIGPLVEGLPQEPLLFRRTKSPPTCCTSAEALPPAPPTCCLSTEALPPVPPTSCLSTEALPPAPPTCCLALQFSCLT